MPKIRLLNELRQRTEVLNVLLYDETLQTENIGFGQEIDYLQSLNRGAISSKKSRVGGLFQRGWAQAHPAPMADVSDAKACAGIFERSFLRKNLP